ncbi:MAG TPA: protein-disulfide reductase DsbD domain-containing protein [Pyrinomonadaceae bacterium]|nr:protein-disulfide reductase DsbD domain-containing protein [Pyrinomonadaceae bacterium]
MKRHTWLIVSIFLISACAKTPSSNPPAAPVAVEPAQIKSTDVVQATPQEATVARGQSGDVIVPIKITRGYHVNANPPTFPYLKATELELPQTDGLSVEFISYPDPLKRKFAFADQELAVYEGEAIIKARVKAERSARSGKRNLSAKLRVQACDETVCYAPGVLDVTVPVNIK